MDAEPRHNASIQIVTKPWQMDLATYESLTPIAKFQWGEKTIRFCTPTSDALWRVKTILTKEPWTVDWLCGIRPGEVLVDVGANIGVYTLFAAVCQGARVFSFEPESQNYALLCRNIHENKLSNQVTAYCLSCSDHVGFNTLHLSQFKVASSCHSVGQAIGFDLKPRETAFSQGSYCISLDEAVDSGALPCPNYIKIDVDGLEHLVITGGLKTLGNSTLKSLLVELNPSLSEHREVVRLLSNLGFSYDPKQVSEAARKGGPFQGIGEWIFSRSSSCKALRAIPKLTYTSPPLSLPHLSPATDSVINHILKRMENTTINEYPFAYAVIDNVFPADYYETILRNFPSATKLIPISSSGRVAENAYRDRHVLQFTDQDLARLESAKREFWLSFASWLYSPKFLNGTINYFKAHIISRLNRISKTCNGLVNIRSDALLVNDQTNYMIGPHTDAPHRLISFLFYMPLNSSKKHLGTTLYSPKEEGFTCEGAIHHSRDLFTRIKTIDFLPNRLVVFPKTNNSFHGVDQIIDETPERQLLINNIRVLRPES